MKKRHEGIVLFDEASFFFSQSNSSQTKESGDSVTLEVEIADLSHM